MKRTVAEINETMRSLAEYTKLQEELTAQIEELKDALKEYMTDENLEEILGENGEHVVWRPVISNRFDTTAFKKSEWGELYKEYSKPTTTKPFKFFA